MKIFAKVVNGQIAEYPVYENHIRNRAQSINQYTECIFDVKPSVPQFHYLRENKKLIEGKVFVNYEILPIPLNQLLYSIQPKNIPGIPTINLTIENIDKEFLERVFDLVKIEVQSRLDAFAASDGFDNMGSLVSYVSSTISSWAAKAKLGVKLRDQTWSTLYDYQDKIMKNIEPIPKTVDDIFKILPVLAWE